MYKVEYNEYAKKVVGKEKGKYQVPVKFNKKAKADKVVNQVLAACWGYSSRDSDDSEKGEDVSIMVMEDEA